MTRIINDAGFRLIKRFEGCRLQAYQDVSGIWTIGYGHIDEVTEGMTITQDQADQFLADDLCATESTVDAVTAQAMTSDDQFAAMVSLCYNIGPRGFKSSTVLRQHLAGNATEAADAFLLWDKATVDGKLQAVQGLLNRRQAERELYLT